ncbi:MAG: hypothetical protein IJF66_02090 [Clostridia bacterium]|nr:hypothetical protein [Clostridia bacterium]
MKKGILFVLILVLLLSFLLVLSACGCSHQNIIIDHSVEATCTAAGLSAGRHCQDCGEVLQAQQIVPATGHTIVTRKGYAATCQSTGLTDGKYCSICGLVTVSQNTIPKTKCVEGADGYCTTCKAVINPHKVLVNYIKRNGEYSDSKYDYTLVISTQYVFSMYYYPNKDEINITLLINSSEITFFISLSDVTDKGDQVDVGALVEYSGYSGEDYASGYIFKSMTSTDYAYIFDFYYVPALSYSLEDSVHSLMISSTKTTLSLFEKVLEDIDSKLSLSDFGFEE